MEDARPRRREDLIVRREGEEYVILDQRSERVHQLNRTASFIWERCDGTRTLGELAEEMLESFAVDRDTASADLRRTIERLMDLGLFDHAGAGW